MYVVDFKEGVCMIYVYNAKNNQISPIARQIELNDAYILMDCNLKQNIDNEVSFNFKNQNISEFLKQDISFKQLKNLKFFNWNNKYDKNTELPKAVLLELEEKIGIIRFLTLKNEVYILEKFFSNMSIAMQKEIVLKLNNYFKIFKQNQVHKIDNIYKFPEYKLWEYHNDYEVVFFEK